MARYWLDKAEVLAPAARTATTTTSAAIDLASLGGVPVMALYCDAASAGTLPTLDAKITHCDTSGGSYTDSGLTFTQVTTAAALQLVRLDRTILKRFVKLVLTIGGTDTPTFPSSAGIVAFEQSGVDLPIISTTPEILTVVKAAQYSTDQAAAGVDSYLLQGWALAHLSVNAVSGTTPTCSIKLRECDTVDGTYADVPGGAFTQVTTVDGDQKIVLDLNLRKRWIGFDVDLGGTNPVYGIHAVLMGEKRT